MSRQLLAEKLVSLAALAERVPSNRREGGVGAQCLWRWAVKGVKRKDGHIVKLEVVTVAGRLCSSEAALARFIEAQQSEPATELPTPARTPGKRRKASERAAAELEAVGI